MHSVGFTVIATGVGITDETHAVLSAACTIEHVGWKNRYTTIECFAPISRLGEVIDDLVAAARTIGATVQRIEPDPLMTLQEMAHLSGLGWSAMFAFATYGTDDPMPGPVARLAADRPLWDWRAVGPWLATRGHIEEWLTLIAPIVEEANRKLGRVAR